MTAGALGFAASYIEKDQPIQLDMDPLDVREPAWTKAFNDAVGKLDRAIADYLQRSGRAPKNRVHAGTSPGYTKGAVIVGVYALARQTAPPSISAPVLSAKGRALYDQIKAQSIPQYTGRGAYTGFVDNSIHLGRGESWAPPYAPYNPGGPTEVNEPGVIRDLNNAWYDACAKFLTAGLQILDDDHIAADHRVSRDAARTYLTSNKGTTVAATLILDAVSMHESETDRINRTL